MSARPMYRLWPDFVNCGWPSFGMLLLGLAGFGLGMIGLALLAARRGRSAWLLGVAAAVVGLLAMGLGALGQELGRAQVDQILASGSVDPAVHQQIRDAGYAEARSCVTVGLEIGAAPLVLGAIALVLGLGAKGTTTRRG